MWQHRLAPRPSPRQESKKNCNRHNNQFAEMHLRHQNPRDEKRKPGKKHSTRQTKSVCIGLFLPKR
jgi:hypothetical protein